jgi:Na+/H+-translocating membrane pyrophosphatase
MSTNENAIQDYTEKPDYGRCVAIVASASLREMIRPGALAIISPMAIGEFLGHIYGNCLILVCAHDASVIWSPWLCRCYLPDFGPLHWPTSSWS